jgi:hypothetical protein
MTKPRLPLRLALAATASCYHRRYQFRARTALLAQRFLGRGLERFSLELSVLLEQNLYFPFRVLQLLPAGRGKLHAFFKEGQRLFQWNFALFQLQDYFLQPLKALFKLHQSILLLAIL